MVKVAWEPKSQSARVFENNLLGGMRYLQDVGRLPILFFSRSVMGV